MAKTFTLSDIDTAVQDELRNTVGTPITQEKRVRAYNRTIDRLQGKFNWDTTKRIKQWEYLQGEPDYSLENDLGLTDYKDTKDIRFVENTNFLQHQKFANVEERDFNIMELQNLQTNKYTIEERDNDKVLRIITNRQLGRTQVSQMDSLTNNGVWASDTSGSDATTLGTDTTRKKQGSASFKFNIDVSQSVNDFAKISTTTELTNSVDGSEIENIGHFRFWLGLHSVTAANIALITNIELRWGSSSSNYWVDTTSTAINAGSLVAGWNRLNFSWEDATEVGTPDAANLDYFEIRINYSSGFTDSNNIRTDDLVMLTPIDMELVYYSQFIVLDGATRQDHFTVSTVNTSEELLLPTEHFRTFVKLSLAEIFPQKERDGKDYIRVVQEARVALEDLSNALGNEVQREQANMSIEGNSSNRPDAWHLQW